MRELKRRMKRKGSREVESRPNPIPEVPIEEVE